MKKRSLKEKLSYQIDKLLSKGAGVLILALFSITAVVVLVVGALMLLIDPEFAQSPLSSLWNTFMYTLDAGTLAGYSSTGVGIFVLALATICGIFVTSMLIGVLSSGLESKLESLRKGDSRVLEANHTVIIGYGETVFVILEELIAAGENAKKPVLVVLGEAEKSIMESEISERVPDWKNCEIICRSGAPSDLTALGRCSIETAKSIIINLNEDAETIKTILAVTHLLNGPNAQNPTTHITASVNEERNVEVAQIAGEGRAEIVYFSSAVSRIIANTCHQPGLSEVYTELFNFGGDEIYIEALPGLAGKTFAECATLFPISSLLGIKRGDVPMLNPPASTVLTENDAVIVLASDDGVSVPAASAPAIDKAQFASATQDASTLQQEHLLVLGYNKLLPAILRELDSYVAPGSQVMVGAKDITSEEIALITAPYQNMSVTANICDIYSGAVLENYVDAGYRSIIVLSALGCEIEQSDAENLMILLHLKSISEKKGIRHSVVSQMLSPKNGELAHIAKVNDFVISTNLTSLILSQISENRNLSAVFADILDADGSELYMKPASRYVQTNTPVSLYAAYQAAASRGECMLGYKTVRLSANGEAQATIVTNPPKDTQVTFTENDLLIVLAEEG